MAQDAKRSACEAGSKMELARHQKTAVAITRVLCRGDYPNRGVLLWHSTGSGKTLTAMAAMDAVWDSTRRIVYVTSVEAASANPAGKFYELAAVLPRFKKMKALDIEAAFRTRSVQFMTFAQLAHQLQLYRGRKADSPQEAEAMRHWLDKSLVVVDEVHSLLTPLPGQSKECEALLTFLQTADDSRTKDLRVLLLTATPGDSVRDVMRLLNVTRRPGSPELAWTATTDKKSFTRRLRGMVSFFDFSADRTRFPRVAHEQHAVEMSLDQALELSRKAGDLDEAKGDLDGKAGLRRIWQPARRYSNTMYSWPKGMDIGTFSAKLAALLDTISKHDGKHLVYSAFSERRGYGGHGARAIVKALVDHAGFKNYSSTDSDGKALTVALLARAQPVKKIVDAFNDADNARGERLKVLVATQGFNEGVDLKGVRHIHVFEPLTSAEDQKQLLGRGVRMCSHDQLKYPDEWTVTLHRYESIVPDVSDASEAATQDLSASMAYILRLGEEQETLKGVRGSTAATARRAELRRLIKKARTTLKLTKDEAKRLDLIAAAPGVDSQVYEMARKRGDEVEKLLQVLRDAAIDCEIFKSFHGRGGIPVACGFKPKK